MQFKLVIKHKKRRRLRVSALLRSQAGAISIEFNVPASKVCPEPGPNVG